MSCFVGVDIGTQSLKVIVVGEDLATLGTADCAYDYVVSRPGWAEQDPQRWLDALAPTIAGALSSSNRSVADVHAIGLVGQLDGCIATDAGGAALSPALIWMDRRATVPTLDPTEVLEITGQVLDASHMAPKIRWLKSDGVSAERFHQPVSFVVERLCGVALFDPGHASTTLLFDQRANDYSTPLLEAFEIERDELPRIAAASDVAGRIDARGSQLCGLPVGTPVCVGTGDDFATPLGSGVVTAGTAACVLGTAEVVGAVSRERLLDREMLVETHNYVGGDYFVENPGWLAGGSIRWAREMLGITSPRAFDTLAADASAGAGGVTFIPALCGAMAPRWRPDVRGCFAGLSAATTQADLARAVLEGCAFAMNDVVVRLVEMGLGIDRVALLGGGASSRLWGQIRADVSGLPVLRVASTLSCARGGAMLAAVCVGAFASVDTVASAAQVPGEVEHTFPESDMTSAYDRYRTLFDAIETVR